jgi:site-specific recombinase XerD
MMAEPEAGHFLASDQAGNNELVAQCAKQTNVRDGFCRKAGELLDSIDTSTPTGLRDRAVIGVMSCAFARVGAVAAMRVEDYFADGKRLAGPVT